MGGYQEIVEQIDAVALPIVEPLSLRFSDCNHQLVMSAILSVCTPPHLFEELVAAAPDRANPYSDADVLYCLHEDVLDVTEAVDHQNCSKEMRDWWTALTRILESGRYSGDIRFIRS